MKKVVLFLSVIFFMSIQINAQQREGNPLLQEWNTPHQTPPFNQIKTEHYLPAFEFAISEAKREIADIAEQKSTPTFENTIVALDRAGALLNRISGVFFNMNSCLTSPELTAVAQKVSPMLTEYGNDINLNSALFHRVKQVYEKPGKLTTEQKQLLEKTYRGFVNSGANLSEADKEKYREISMKLSTLSLDFGQNTLKYTNSWHKHFTDKSQLKGMPEMELSIAQAKAKSKGLDGYVFDLSTPSYLAIMKYADDRELRKEFYLKSSAKCYGGEFDNRQLVKEIITYRDAIAKLLGNKNYAEYALKDRMAENVGNVYELLDNLLKYSLPAAKNEMASLTEYAKSLGFSDEIQRWDFTYYSEKQKNALYDLSDEMLKPYFKLENVIDGVFGLATTLFDLKFVPNKEIQPYHPDVKVYEVYRNDKFMAVLYMDFHPRESKREGAWMTSFREQHVDAKGKDVRPLVSIVMNFTPSTADQPSLLSFSETTTFLHEFGHALHGMLSETTYESISGTSVPRDFVELPSQMMENWASTNDFLKTFAFHYKTGEVIPQALIQKLRDYENYQAGYLSCRQLSFGYLDLMWYTTDPASISDVLKMEREVMDKMEVMPVVPGACMSTSFGHIFAGGYAAGYYGYKWAEVLDADAFSLFQEKGVLNKKVADSFVENILSKGGSDKPMNLYVNFRGRKPDSNALLKRSGLIE
ncbi:M3 family metallopeptidase [Bacteroidales bacterium OttesenSCG-928-B11]|nr:M3 family metallopeptidase [Bacteroidales bacterium OttesenSCG-928-C03]MDL2313064.1 M3 family metallopeptidase [Bacteroidales bacterium OttesenSCG-928-B11]